MAELKHHGIPKMRWGFRRFQNYDGTLTAAGKERYRKNKDSSDTSSSSENKGKNSAKGNNEAQVHDDHKSAFDKKPVASMSDAELRRRLNRIDMEQRYNKANPRHIARGYETTKKILAVAGTASLALTTAVNIKTNADKIAEWFS